MSNCTSCGRSAFAKQHATLPYLRKSGVDVFLRNVTQWHCVACGDTSATIPGHAQLNRTIANHYLDLPRRLGGPEIKLLRALTTLTAGQFAARLQVPGTTLSGWESDGSGRRPNRSSELMIRTLVSQCLLLGRNLDTFPKLEKESSCVAYSLTAVLHHHISPLGGRYQHHVAWEISPMLTPWFTAITPHEHNIPTFLIITSSREPPSAP